MAETSKRVAVPLDDDTYAKLKFKCFFLDKNMTDVVRGMIDEFVEDFDIEEVRQIVSGSIVNRRKRLKVVSALGLRVRIPSGIMFLRRRKPER